jgi:protein O-GlcNAc transferase
MNFDKTLLQAFEQYEKGNFQHAEDICRKILKAQPNNIRAHNLLGDILRGERKFDESIIHYKRAMKIDPKFPASYFNLGKTLQQKGEFDDAITYYQKVIDLDPAFPGSYVNLGNIYQEKGLFDNAINCYQKAIELDPNFPGSYVNLGNIYQEKGLFDNAVNCYQKAISINPIHVTAFHNLGHVYQEKGLFSDAIAFYQKALQLNPLRADTYSSLGNVYFNQGNLDKAEECFRHALNLKPDSLYAYQHLLLLVNCNSRYDMQNIYCEHLNFAKQLAEPLYSTIIPFINERTPDRRLKIGYVSSDFRRHSVSFFIEPVLYTHNKKHFEIFCYSTYHKQDDVTLRLQGYADNWINIAGMSDEKAAELIREDKIDILIDLAGHTAYSRILLFARKPAPIQVTWIGYPATTGLATIDYKIVDKYTDPPGITEHFYTEELIRLNDCFLCYLPDSNSPTVAELPSVSTDHVTFGSFNHFAKISPEIISLWAKILKTIPNSHLVLKSKSLSDITVCSSLIAAFAQKNIAAERITLFSWMTSQREHLDLYNRIDIGLDTFPYNGATTTCEALWMGIPVITLEGTTPASRVGVSLMSNVGLPELIAKTQEEYIRIAVNLANDTKKLQKLRRELRNIMACSPLTNAKQFTVNLEHSYHKMWEKWCKSA